MRQARGMRLEKVAIPEFMAPFSQPLEVFRDLTGEVITPKIVYLKLIIVPERAARLFSLWIAALNTCASHDMPMGRHGEVTEPCTWRTFNLGNTTLLPLVGAKLTAIVALAARNFHEDRARAGAYSPPPRLISGGSPRAWMTRRRGVWQVPNTDQSRT